MIFIRLDIYVLVRWGNMYILYISKWIYLNNKIKFKIKLCILVLIY